MKPFGYLLFVYFDKVRGFEDTGHKKRIDVQDDGILLQTYEELINAYDRHIDDKWDVKDRDKIHYWYLDLSTGEYESLPKWKNGYIVGNVDEKKVKSTKVFRNIK